MPRKRNVLVAEFPYLTKNEASKRLREVGGDLDRARELERATPRGAAMKEKAQAAKVKAEAEAWTRAQAEMRAEAAMKRAEEAERMMRDMLAKKKNEDDLDHLFKGNEDTRDILMR
jgi:hypothetical protein